MTQTVDLMEWHHEVPRSIRKHVIFGIALFAIAFGGFGTWAFRAPLAAAVISQGSFVATGQNKIVQHLEGGIIEAILVSEGDRISKGDQIIQLKQTAAQADLREMEFRKARLEAAEARVRAEYDEAEEVTFSPRLLQLAKENQQVAQIVEDQRLSFASARHMQQKELEILENGIASLQIRSKGYKAQLAAYRARGVNLGEELSDKEALLERGLIRRPEFNYVRRAMLETDGHIARIESEVEEIERSRLKFELEIEKLTTERRRKALGASLRVSACNY